MTRRKSIEIEGFHHANPIPAASRIGNLLMSGTILGRDAITDTIPDTLEGQCALVFRHIRDIMEAAGGSTEDILKIHVWLKDPTNRGPVNAEWTAMFPDPESRPARHTFPDNSDSPYLISCDITAVLPDS